MPTFPIGDRFSLDMLKREQELRRAGIDVPKTPTVIINGALFVPHVMQVVAPIATREAISEKQNLGQGLLDAIKSAARTTIDTIRDLLGVPRALPADAAGIDAELDRLPPHRRDELARKLFAAKTTELGDASRAMEWMNALPIDTRLKMMPALRKQVLLHENELNRPLIEGMYAKLERDAFERDFAELRADPGKRAALRATLIDNLTATGGENFEEVTVEGKAYRLKTPAKHQPALDKVYSEIDAYMSKFGAPEAGEMRSLLLGGASDDKVSASTVFVRPGLGNVHPTIWWFAEMGKHLEPGANMVLAYSWTDGAPGSQLRPASGDPYIQKQLATASKQIREVLPGGEGERAIAALRDSISRLYLSGSPRHTFQDYQRSGAQFVKQYLDIERDAKSFGLDLSRPATFAHSQGNMDANLLNGFFAAAGRTKPTIGEIYGLAPATSGSPIADDDKELELATLLLGGEPAMQSVRHLDPDTVRKHMPRALMSFNAATFVSDVDSKSPIPKGQNLPGLGLGDKVNRVISAAGGGDALVPHVAKSFVGDERNAFELGPYDHYGIFAWGALRDAFGQWKNIRREDTRREELVRLLAR